MIIGLDERENGCNRLEMMLKTLLLENYSHKFINATDDLNEAVFRKDIKSIAKAC